MLDGMLQSLESVDSPAPTVSDDPMAVDSSENCQEPPIRDEFCDPDHPRAIQFQDISAAAYKIKDGVQKTPCTVRLTYYNKDTKVNIILSKISDIILYLS